ncbi:MAG TPA: O-antigen ligase family protein [Chitinophagaceae bacterium]
MINENLSIPALRINRFFPFVFIYFFLNTIGLPLGLTWMALLGPFFYIWVVMERKTEIFLPFITVLLPFIIVHIAVVGVDLTAYAVSLLNITLVYFFCQAAYTFLKRCSDMERIFRKLLVINFICCLIGIVFYFTPWDYLFWIEQGFTKGVNDFRRFKLFTYEASYYATVFIPVFFFYLLQYVLCQNRIKNHWLLLMLFLPFVLSFSIGVIAAAILSGILATIIYGRQLLVKRRIENMAINLVVLIASSAVVLVLYFRHNPIFTRILNIFSGDDTSAKGRMGDSFMLAMKMLEEKNQWFGIGPGQVKLVGHDLIHGHYLYTTDFVAAIPNAMAETLAVFGWFGFSLKLLIEITLFFTTKVWSNYYRLLLFFFMFIYQFTGSFITNLAEYVIWIFAFTPVFRQFDVKHLSGRRN